MFCKHCDYPLWQIRDRICPECGAAFRPSEFEFRPNTVRFCCPRCGQSYYGTDERGHLVPRSFACVSCRAAIDMDEMVLLPAEGVAEHQTRAEVMPWLKRAEVGRIAGWFRTCVLGLFAPVRLVRLIDAPAPWQALWFATINAAVFLSVYFLLGFGFFFVFAVAGAAPGMAVVSMLAIGAGQIITVLAMMLFWAVIAHGVLRVTGRTAHGIGRTVEMMCYGSPSLVLTAVPCVGAYLSPLSAIWWTVVAVLMVWAGQEVRAWRAVTAVATPMLVLMTAAIVGVVLLVMSISSTVQTAAATMRTTVGESATTPIAEALMAYRTAHGEWPGHALELVLGGEVTASQFVTSAWQVMAGTTAPDTIQFDTLGPEQLSAAVDRAVRAMPDGVIAHRLGDFVFTYHGIDPADPPEGLWIAILWPQVDLSAAPAFARPDPAVVMVDGTVHSMPARGFDAILGSQNARRELVGLAPLPHPRDVNVDEPVGPP
jgi:type II secretory pathway pseudopilin PulG